MSAPPVSLVETLRDRYRVERELGRGRMATVWLALDLRPDRPVAIKVLRPAKGLILMAAGGVKARAQASWRPSCGRS